ncbi:DUF3530 family protein [Colwellia psychrerythraea]|uniref:DUF3530 domain-containing protein n=1 Tax=Colwellia psychrerythraea TaxID=28229 RepID=A0A099KX85_COLPS|nr:DUF3530 family protein [Colwellia psychrerythraea]KGJ94258.1 Protein of unknown function DUF3530 [Colwellia psychrerythraea]
MHIVGLPDISRNKLSPTLIVALMFTLLFISCASMAEEKKPESATENKPKVVNKTTAIKKPIELTKQHKEDLKHYLATEQVQPLLAGPDDYLTLVKRYTSANSKGVVILLPEWQQGATNPKAINYLRNELPAKGWSTIAIQPSNKPEGYPSSAITVEQQKEENQLTLKEYKSKLNSMLNAVMNTARKYPGIVLVIAQGNNAALLIDIYSQDSSLQPNALIMLSSYRQSNHAFINSLNEQFAHQVASSELPILDLYLKYDNPLVLNKAAQRKAFSKQEMKVYYRQRQLNNTVTGYYPEEELFSQINSWLKAIGW